MNRFALLVPDMPTREELAPYLERIDQARWYSNFGPLVKELEGRFAGTIHSQFLFQIRKQILGLD